MDRSALELRLRQHVRTYQDFNASACAELTSTPSPLAFHRFVAANRPVVIRGQGQRDQIRALDRWTDDYLVRMMEEKEVAISVDPTGNADSIVNGHFVEPATVDMPLSQLFEHLKDESRSDARSERPVYYLQTQNGNLSNEYSALLEDVGLEGPAWAREVFGERPDVANIWIGGARSVTSMHKDPYENVYLVVRGSKTFVLLPPSEAYCVHEQQFPHASWTFDPTATGSGSSFTLTPTDPPVSLPWIPIDPLAPDLDKYPRYACARPMTVRLDAGDMLYLPAMWYHHVSQTPDYFAGTSNWSGRNDKAGEPTGVKATIAINWWTDVKYDGAFWSSTQLVRSLVNELDGRTGEEGSDDESDP
ncbi:hypothetical protein JCM10212_004905 [Sporobolomyces blumeae]